MRRLDGLRDLLRGFDDDPGNREAMFELASADDPFSRDGFEPGHFTASGFVLSPGGRSLLLIHHRRLDRWMQPGGHIDPDDESVEAAARREVREETGVNLEPDTGELIDIDIHEIPAGNGEPGHQHFDVRFRFVASDTLVSADRDEVNDAKWFALEDVAGDVGDTSVRRVAKRLLDLR